MKTLVLPAAIFSTLTLSLFVAGDLSAQDYWGDAGTAATNTNTSPTTAGAATAGYGYEDSTYAVGGRNSTAMGSLLGESDFSYGYLDASYYFFDFDRDNFDSAHGFGGALSIPLFDSIYLKGAANYAASEDMETGADVDYLDWQAGVGIGLPLMNRFDLILEGGLAHRSLEVDSIDNFDDLTDGYGWYVAPGVRVGLNEFIEINGTVRYISVDDTNDLGFNVDALIHLTPNVSLKGGVLFTDDANQYGVGLRINF
jgi:hypothetical protein